MRLFVLLICLAAVAFSCSPAPDRQQVYECWLREADTDNDGLVSLAEVQALDQYIVGFGGSMTTHLDPYRANDYQALFDACDQNGDGYLDPDDVDDSTCVAAAADLCEAADLGRYVTGIERPQIG